MNISCTLCHKPLMIREEFAGKPMRCPHCQGVFQAPSLAAAPAPEPQGFAFAPAAGNQELGDLPVTSDHTNAVDFDWTAAQVSTGKVLQMATGNRSAGVVHDAPVARIGLGPGWQLVNFGLRLQAYAVMMLFGVSAFMVFASLVVSVGAAGTLTNMGIMLSYVVGFGGLVMGLAGCWMCTAVPPESELKPLTFAAAGTLSAAALVLIVALLTAPRQDGNTTLVEAIASGIGMFGSIVLAAGAICMLLFLRGAAYFFGDKYLAQNLTRFVIFALSVPLVLRFVTLSVRWFTKLTESVEAKAAVQMLHFLVALILFIWLFNLLRDLRRIIHTGLQRHAVASVSMSPTP
ncbi:MAG: hypothetical protein AB7K24_05975 [Gemmataceae bacterium]